ncbi:uncharacterized protein LOC110860899 [Folsomia candida]|uniref:uncharacterized protein LOC110860899 n=1 Tax=Folsomia candida TaxID=158441 RepID=UPI000B902162|nr:uncharacterized protein LOC110860899 [Folsomia candida]
MSMKYLILAVAIILGESVTSHTTQKKEITSQTRNGINFSLTYLGTFNQKLYYIDNIGANYADARSNCQTMGMRLLKFEAIEELAWIVNSAPNSVNIWTDGMSHIVPASFEWKTTGARVSDSVTVVKDLYYGLLFKRGTQALTERDRGAVNPYVCYMILSQVQQIPQVPLGTSEIEGLPNIVITSVDTLDENVGPLPKLSFIGRYGKKSFFLESGIKANQPDARSNCTAIGMKLATIDSQAELEWIVSMTSDSDRPIWTDGVIKADPGSYRWFSDNSPLLSQLRIGYIAIGLEIRNAAGLYSRNNESFSLRNYLCYAETS